MKQAENRNRITQAGAEDSASPRQKSQHQTMRKPNPAAMRRLWDELHPGPPPPIAHPIPPLTPTPIPETPLRSARFGVPRAILHPGPTLLAAVPFFAGLALMCTGCQVLTYAGPNGE